MVAVMISTIQAVEATPNWPAWLSDRAILPADRALPIHGTATPGAQIRIQFARITATARADENGHWRLTLQRLPAGARGDLTLQVDETMHTLREVAVGSLWLCAGQSNMAMSVHDAAEAEALAAGTGAAGPLRMWTGAAWTDITPANAQAMSAVAISFGTALSRRMTNEPVGVIVAAKGGTSIDAWIPTAAFPPTERGARLRALADDPAVHAAAAVDERAFLPYGSHRLATWGLSRAAPSALFTNLLAPLAGMPISGLLWYQGESDAESLEAAREYAQALTAFIDATRTLLDTDALPVLLVNLPAYTPPDPEKQTAWQLVRDAQAQVANALDDIALVDILDLGDPQDIHPRRKQAVGERAALLAEPLLRRSRDPFHQVRSWVFHLTNYRDNKLAEIEAAGVDLAVIDLGRDGGADYFTRAEIAALQTSNRMVLAYFAIGSIETYRPEWDAVPAALKSSVVEGWPDEYFVKFWDEGWWPVVRGRIDQALDAGYNGAYLDLVTAYEEIPLSAAEPGTTREDLAHRMVALIARISAYAKARDPVFKIVPQNCPELYTWSHWEQKPNLHYLNAMDGIGIESVFFIAHDKPADADWCVENRNNARAIRRAGKVVLGVDYAKKPDTIRTAYASMRNIGFVPYVSVRNLDRVAREAEASSIGLSGKPPP